MLANISGSMTCCPIPLRLTSAIAYFQGRGWAVVGDPSRCPACGEQNKELARFCRECGSPLGTTAQHASPEPDTSTLAQSSQTIIPFGDGLSARPDGAA